MKDKIRRFFYGRYGVDQLAYALITVFFILSLFNIWYRSSVLNILCLVILFFLYFRMLSKNYAARRKENNVYLQIKYKFINFFKDKKERFHDRNTFKYLRCPNCKQRLRVPKGKGEISITCAKCKIKFDAKS